MMDWLFQQERDCRMLCCDNLLVKILLNGIDCSKQTTEVGNITVIDDNGPDALRNVDMTIPMLLKASTGKGGTGSRAPTPVGVKYG
jgi:hypothetical protein